MARKYPTRTLTDSNLQIHSSAFASIEEDSEFQIVGRKVDKQLRNGAMGRKRSTRYGTCYGYMPCLFLYLVFRIPGGQVRRGIWQESKLLFVFNMSSTVTCNSVRNRKLNRVFLSMCPQSRFGHVCLVFCCWPANPIPFAFPCHCTNFQRYAHSCQSFPNAEFHPGAGRRGSHVF